MHGLRRIIGLVCLSSLGALLVGAGIVAFAILSRPPLAASTSTTHPTLGRSDCVDCHAPIAEEWRQSYHYRSLTGTYWQDVRQLGYLELFDKARKPCLNCHAPANVLDVGDGSVSRAASKDQLGVECTPNILRNPQGSIPAARLDDVELGVDCTACHVSKRGIVGAGRRPRVSDHETIADPRFQNPSIASETLCRTCHRTTVEAWRRTALAAGGTTCLDCHMPEVRAPSVAGGVERVRRSHSFRADKDDAMLRNAMNATLEITADREARVRLRNDRVGHDLPSGGNWLSVRVEAFDAAGQGLSHLIEVFGKDEPLLLDFWPFNADSRIRSGATRDILLPLPRGSGTVEAVLRYHDWMKTKRTVLTLRADY